LKYVDDWWSVVCNSGMPGMVKRLPETVQAKFKVEHLQSVQSLAGEQGLWMDAGILVPQGRVPAA